MLHRKAILTALPVALLVLNALPHPMARAQQADQRKPRALMFEPLKHSRNNDGESQNQVGRR